jgi:predicted transcriptional regulator YdeE
MSMTGILARLFAHPIDPIEPRIVQLEQPILIVGMGVDTSLRTVFRDVPALGKRLSAYKREHPIPHLKQPWAFAAVSRDFDERTGAFFYFMGDVVSCFDQLPSELTAFEIPVLTYAVFRVRPKNRFGWGIAIANSKRHAYRTWLPVSRYEAAKVIDDFEYHDERSTRKTNPEIELYVAVKERV